MAYGGYVEGYADAPASAPAPYYGQIRPMKRERIRATWAGVTYDVMASWVDNWPQEYSNPRDATVAVSATDGFKIFAGMDLGTIWKEVVEQNSPSFWAKFQEGQSTTTGDTVLDSSSNQYSGVVVGTPQFSAEPDLGSGNILAPDGYGMKNTGLAEKGVRFDNVTPLNTSQPFAVVITFTTEALTNQFIAAQIDPDTLAGWSLQMTSVGTFFFTVGGESTYVQATYAAGALLPQSHHFIATWDGAREVRLYRDVDSYSSGTGTADVTTTADLVVAGYLPSSLSDPPSLGLYGVIDELVVIPGTFSQIAVDYLYGSILAPYWAQFYGLYPTELLGIGGSFDEDLPGERVHRVLDFADWPTADRDIDSGATVLQGVASFDKSVLEVLQKINDSEQGNLFMSKTGAVRFQDRETILGGVAIKATFGDGPGELRYQDISYDYGDAQIFNEAVVGREDGANVGVINQASKSEFQRKTMSRTGLPHRKDADSRNIALMLLRRLAQPVRRIRGLTINPRHDPALLFPVVLGLELGDRIRVIRRPQAVGTAVTQDLIVEEIGHQVDASTKSWVTTLSLSPAAPLQYWLAEVAGFGEAGVTTYAGF